MPNHHADRLIAAREALCGAVKRMTFEGAGVAAVYNPIDYARPMADAYIRTYVDGPRRVLMFGMNPGPWGMAQNGVPFGEVAAVRDFLKLDAPIGQPTGWSGVHPKRPIEGMACTRSEVSGRRVWALLKDRYGDAATALGDLHVLNFCPLVFMGETGKNITPDRLVAADVSDAGNNITIDLSIDRAVESFDDNEEGTLILFGGSYEQSADFSQKSITVKLGD